MCEWTGFQNYYPKFSEKEGLHVETPRKHVTGISVSPLILSMVESFRVSLVPGVLSDCELILVTICMILSIYMSHESSLLSRVDPLNPSTVN